MARRAEREIRRLKRFVRQAASESRRDSMATVQKPAGGASALRFEIDAKRLDELDRKHKLPGFASLTEHAETRARL